MSNKFKKSVVFRSKHAGDKMAAHYRKLFAIGLDGKTRRYGRKSPALVCSVCGKPSGVCIHGPDFTTTPPTTHE